MLAVAEAQVVPFHDPDAQLAVTVAESCTNDPFFREKVSVPGPVIVTG